MTERELSSQRINELRKSHKMSLEKFGEIAGVTKSTVLRWENGCVDTLKTGVVQKLSHYFNVSPLWLLGYNCPKEKESAEHEELSNQVSNELIWLNEKQIKKILKFIEEYIK